MLVGLSSHHGVHLHIAQVSEVEPQVDRVTRSPLAAHASPLQLERCLLGQLWPHVPRDVTAGTAGSSGRGSLDSQSLDPTMAPSNQGTGPSQRGKVMGSAKASE